MPFISWFAVRNTPSQITVEPGNCFVGVKIKINGKAKEKSKPTANEIGAYFPL